MIPIPAVVPLEAALRPEVDPLEVVRRPEEGPLEVVRRPEEVLLRAPREAARPRPLPPPATARRTTRRTCWSADSERRTAGSGPSNFTSAPRENIPAGERE